MRLKLPLTLIGMIVATAALALPPFVGVFKKTYKAPPASALGKATCNACHVGMSPKLNPYGLDMKKVTKNKKLDAATLKKVEALDSDKDKVRNIVEIKKGTLPGDPKSK